MICVESSKEEAITTTWMKKLIRNHAEEDVLWTTWKLWYPIAAGMQFSQ